jgi:hypothetical protein
MLLKFLVVEEAAWGLAARLPRKTLFTDIENNFLFINIIWYISSFLQFLIFKKSLGAR